MIETLAEKISTYLKDQNEEETTSIAIMKYSLIIIINVLVTIIFSFTIGAITGKLLETSVTFAIASILRFISGGFHFKSATNCIVVSTILISCIPHIAISKEISFYFTLLGLILFIIYAPSNITGHTRIPEKYFPYLKLVSVVFVGCNLIIQNQIFALIFLLQGISLIRFERRKPK